jgi:hypothetical protein
MRSVTYIAVPGTRGGTEQADWFSAKSPFAEFLSKRDLFNAAGLAIPFCWSTDLNGIGRNHQDWKAGGASLFYYGAAFPSISLPPQTIPEMPRAMHCAGLMADRTVIISHSHGRQVVLYAAALGMKIDRWIDVSGPVREDMLDVQKVGRPNIRQHLHLHGGKRDVWQWFGELFDGHLGIVRDDPMADKNEEMRGGHSDVLRKASYFQDWVTRGWVDFLRSGS